MSMRRTKTPTPAKAADAAIVSPVSVKQEPTSTVTQDMVASEPANFTSVVTVEETAQQTPEEPGATTVAVETTADETATATVEEQETSTAPPQEPTGKDWEPFVRRGLVITAAGTVQVKTFTRNGTVNTKKLYTNSAVDARGHEVHIEAWCDAASEVCDQLRAYFDLVLKNNPKPVVFMFPAEETLQVRDLAFRLTEPSTYQSTHTDIQYVWKLSYGEYGAVRGAEKVTAKALPRAFSVATEGPFHLDGEPLNPPSEWAGEDQLNEDIMLAAATSPISLDQATPSKRGRND